MSQYKIEQAGKTNKFGHGKPLSKDILEMPIDELQKGECFTIPFGKYSANAVAAIVYRQNRRETRNFTGKQFISRTNDEGTQIIRIK